LNTKISAEAELVAIGDVMAQVLRTRHLLSVQGTASTIYQDNKRKILVAEIRKQSSSRQSCHLDFCFYCSGQNLKRINQGGIQSYTQYAGGLLYQATTGNTLCANARKITKPFQWHIATVHRRVLESQSYGQTSKQGKKRVD